MDTTRVGGNRKSDAREPGAQSPAAACDHLQHVRITQLAESVDGCGECLKTGDPWLHLRMCLECGEVGCCDSSPNRHASRHAAEKGHPIIRSLEPGEQWSYCYVDDVSMVIPEVKGAPRIPPSPLEARRG